MAPSMGASRERRGRPQAAARLAPAPTRRQAEITEAVVRWYLDVHHGQPGDPGLIGSLSDTARLGYFAADPQALAALDGGALFRLLVGVAMFQRRQDVQIAAILRGMTREQAGELTDPGRLLDLAEGCGCPNAQSVQALASACDLTKDPRTKVGTCAANPGVDCHLKRHTVWMRRYGHFGKIPTSAALVIREAGASDLGDLIRGLRRSSSSRARRAEAIEAALCRVWRVSDKIAAMFLSALANPDVAPGGKGWQDVDWRRYVVVDSNVDLFLKALNYRGPGSYDARREFIKALSAGLDLRSMKRGLRKNNPRIVQQAMFLFMSAANRRSLPHDCMHQRPDACLRCPRQVAGLCPVRRAPLDPRRRSLAVLPPG